MTVFFTLFKVFILNIMYIYAILEIIWFSTITVISFIDICVHITIKMALCCTEPNDVAHSKNWSSHHSWVIHRASPPGDWGLSPMCDQG